MEKNHHIISPISLDSFLALHHRMPQIADAIAHDPQLPKALSASPYA
jgi:hypothetical protein